MALDIKQQRIDSGALRSQDVGVPGVWDRPPVDPDAPLVAEVQFEAWLHAEVPWVALHGLRQDYANACAGVWQSYERW
jgi:hypothetical protein